MSWSQGFVGKVDDPLRVGFFIRRTLGWPTGGVEVGLSSQEVLRDSWEDWVALCLGRHLLPCLNALGCLLTCPAWLVLEAWGKLLPLLCGRREAAWEELLPSPEGRRTVAWEELLPSPKGRWAALRRELLPSPGGRWAIARVRGLPEAWLLDWVTWGELFPSKGRWAAAGRKLLPSLGGRWAIAGVELRGAWLLTKLLAWTWLLTSLVGREVPTWVLAWDVLLPSQGGKHYLAWLIGKLS